MRLHDRLRLPPRHWTSSLALQGMPPLFSITSGTLFHSRKIPLRGYLMAIAIFCNEVKGKSMLAMSRDLGTAYQTSFVLAHKLREAMASEVRQTHVGGDVKPVIEFTTELIAKHLG
jgi:hypothetical protein